MAWRYDLHAKGVEPQKCYQRELVFILSRFRRVNILKLRWFFYEMEVYFFISTVTQHYTTLERLCQLQSCSIKLSFRDVTSVSATFTN